MILENMAEAQLRRIRELKEKFLEYVDFTVSEIEAEARKRSAQETEVQGKEEDLPESEEEGEGSIE